MQRDKTRIVVGGSHGKTTTTSMIMHVLRYHNIPMDYLVGAQLEGFDLMVSLSDAPVMVLEGDEYLASPIDRRPKFWFYRPHIAVLTGIAWDHINVFPTFEIYRNQFVQFVEYIEDSGRLFWYKNDEHLDSIVSFMKKSVKDQLYDTPDYKIIDGTITIHKNGKNWPVKVFGDHNLQNMEAARLVCNELNVNEDAFYTAMGSFEGASKRMQLLAENTDSAIFLDFAHAPSKARATVSAVRLKYPDHKLIACLELHTFSSLTKSFQKEYDGSMAAADEALVFFSNHTLKMKKLPELSEAEVKEAFQQEDLQVFSDKKTLHDYLFSLKLDKAVLLLMSSGKFGGLNINDLVDSTHERRLLI